MNTFQKLSHSPSTLVRLLFEIITSVIIVAFYLYVFRTSLPFTLSITATPIITGIIGIIIGSIWIYSSIQRISQKQHKGQHLHWYKQLDLLASLDWWIMCTLILLASFIPDNSTPFSNTIFIIIAAIIVIGFLFFLVSIGIIWQRTSKNIQAQIRIEREQQEQQQKIEEQQALETRSSSTTPVTPQKKAIGYTLVTTFLLSFLSLILLTINGFWHFMNVDLLLTILGCVVFVLVLCLGYVFGEQARTRMTPQHLSWYRLGWLLLAIVALIYAAVHLLSFVLSVQHAALSSTWNNTLGFIYPLAILLLGTAGLVLIREANHQATPQKSVESTVDLSL